MALADAEWLLRAGLAAYGGYLVEPKTVSRQGGVAPTARAGQVVVAAG